MKKALSIILALSCLIAMSVPTFAAVTTDGGTGASVLTYNVSQSFTVTIPESVTINPETRAGSSTVSASDSVIPFGSSLNVAITASSNYSEGFRLKDGANSSYVSYTIMKDAANVALNAAFLSVPAGTAAGTATLNYQASVPTRAGSFTDNLTFTVTID